MMINCENCIHEYDCDWEDAEDCEEYVEEGENDKGDTQEQGLHGEASIC